MHSFTDETWGMFDTVGSMQINSAHQSSAPCFSGESHILLGIFSTTLSLLIMSRKTGVTIGCNTFHRHHHLLITVPMVTWQWKFMDAAGGFFNTMLWMLAYNDWGKGVKLIDYGLPCNAVERIHCWSHTCCVKRYMYMYFLNIKR